MLVDLKVKGETKELFWNKDHLHKSLGKAESQAPCTSEDVWRYKMESLVQPQYHTKYGKFVCRMNIQVLLTMR